jgi:hypothetical protein
MFLINTSTSGANCFYGYYDQNTNKFYLRNDANTGWLGGFAPGANNIIENSYAKLDCTKSTISGSGTTLTVKWAITFKPAFGGQKNTYLYVKDDANAAAGWTQKGTYTIESNQILSISINPKIWNIGSLEVNKTITMPQPDKITVTNDGTGPESFAISLINPFGWSASTTPGIEIYSLNGIFCNTTDVPQNQNFNQDASVEDVVLTTSKTATSTVFAYTQGTANGVNVSSGSARALFLQFKSPAITSKTTEQQISVIITAQTP